MHVSALLNAHDPKEKIAANGGLDSAIGRLLGIVGELSKSKSGSELFFRFKTSLRVQENRIAVERRRYNQRCRTTTRLSVNFQTVSGQVWRLQAG